MICVSSMFLLRVLPGHAGFRNRTESLPSAGAAADASPQLAMNRRDDAGRSRLGSRQIEAPIRAGSDSREAPISRARVVQIGEFWTRWESGSVAAGCGFFER